MGQLVHNLGLEVQIYPTETPVAWTTDDIRKSAQLSRETGEPFARRAVLGTLGCDFRSLKTALQAADLAITATSELFAATPITYEWGLYEGNPPASLDIRYNSSSSHHLIPNGLSLVALVSAVPEPYETISHDKHDSQWHRVCALITQTYKPMLNAAPFRSREPVPTCLMSDIRDPSTFMINPEDESAARILVDIEPRIQAV